MQGCEIHWGGGHVRVSTSQGEDCGAGADVGPGTLLLQVDLQRELLRNAEPQPDSRPTASESAF